MHTATTESTTNMENNNNDASDMSPMAVRLRQEEATANQRRDSTHEDAEDVTTRNDGVGHEDIVGERGVTNEYHGAGPPATGANSVTPAVGRPAMAHTTMQTYTTPLTGVRWMQPTAYITPTGATPQPVSRLGTGFAMGAGTPPTNLFAGQAPPVGGVQRAIEHTLYTVDGGEK